MDLVRQAWRIVLLRTGPQDLPYSPVLTLNSLLLLGVALLLIRSALPTPADAPPLWGTLLIAVGTTALWPWCLLSMRKKRERFAQATLGFASSSLVFLILALPLQWMAAGALPADSAAKPSTGVAVAAVLLLAMLVWKLRVDAHLWAATLDIPRLPALFLAIALAVAEILLLNAL